jgi:hypothetical protein
MDSKGDEMVSALLLEQAALADLQLPMPSRRKFAFHMAMAAARYEKSGMVCSLSFVVRLLTEALFSIAKEILVTAMPLSSRFDISLGRCYRSPFLLHQSR